MPNTRPLGALTSPCFFPGGLLPIRIDVEVDEKHYKDSFLWNPTEPDSSLHDVIQEAVRDSVLPQTVVGPALHQAQSIHGSQPYSPVAGRQPQHPWGAAGRDPTSSATMVPGSFRHGRISTVLDGLQRQGLIPSLYRSGALPFLVQTKVSDLRDLQAQLRDHVRDAN